MLKTKMIKYVCTVFRNREQGFTFISMLLTVTVLFLTLPLLAYLVKAASYSSHYEELKLQHFFHFLQNEVIYAKGYTVDSNKIQLVLVEGSEEDKPAIATFEQYNDLIRRQVDGKGHEIYLRDVKDFAVTLLPYGFNINILTLQGERYEKTIVFDG